MEYTTQEINSEVFTIPVGVNLEDYGNVYDMRHSVLENLCVYLCAGKTNKKALETVRYVHYTQIDEYLKLRNAKIDEFVREYGDGTRYVVDFLRLCKESELNPYDMSEFIVRRDCMNGLLKLAGYVRGGCDNRKVDTECGDYADAISMSYPDAREVIDKMLDKAIMWTGELPTKEFLYFMDTVLGRGGKLEPFLYDTFVDLPNKLILTCAKLARTEDALEMYFVLRMTSEETLDTIKVLSASKRKYDKSEALIDSVGIKLEELTRQVPLF